MQYEFGEGPCYEAVKEEGNFLSEDVSHDARWPRWGPEAAKLGLNSLLGLRLQTRKETFGALNLYHRQPRAYDDDDVAVAGIFAAHASVALAASNNDANLRRAIDTRHVIGQAQGILMVKYGLDDVRAFAVLRRLSQDGNIKLRQVAQQIVDEHASRPDGPGQLAALRCRARPKWVRPSRQHASDQPEGGIRELHPLDHRGDPGRRWDRGVAPEADPLGIVLIVVGLLVILWVTSR